MQYSNLTDFITRTDRRTLSFFIGGGLALIAVILGIALAFVGPLLTIIMLVVLAAALWVISDLEYALWSIIGVIALLPFATLPFKIVITPSFLNLAMGAFLFLYVMQWMTGERRRLETTPVHPLLILFVVLSLFSFVMGLRHAGLTSRSLRVFAELMLSMTFALILVDVLKNERMLKRFARILILAGVAAALIGIVLWVMPDRLAEAVLIRLSVIGYPSGGVIRYVEQNPELPERAIGTAVNPNSMGGFLVMVAALAAPQMVSNEPLFGKQWISYVFFGILGVCLVLTFSRGSMLALGAALFVIAALRYRKLLWIMIAVGLLILLLPWTQFYIERFIEGFQGADLATQMRFGEYTDALRLITRYPVIGAGFTGAPDIDLYLAVANVYLTIASNMGLVGLSAFLTLILAVFLYAWNSRQSLAERPQMYAIWMGSWAGLLGALVNGLFDHYFFNLEFSHAVALFWIYIGMTLAVSRVARQDQEDRQMASALLKKAGAQHRLAQDGLI